MKNEFVLAFNEVIEEKQLPREVILKALESAMVHAYRRAINLNAQQQVEARIDPDTGKVAIYAEKEVVDAVEDDRTEVELSEAKKYDPDAELGMIVVVESTPSDFGRVAAQTARQVIQQRIRDAERQAQLEFYETQLGEIVSDIIQAVNAQGLTVGLELRAEGFISRKDMIPGERYRPHDRVRAFVAEVKDSPRGPQIVLSRTHRDFLRRLLENEVPEIYHGVVEIRSIAREPGERAKVAVSAAQSGIDPVGACVGIRGVRIQAIVRELHDEKIDVIEWNNDPIVFIAKAISPARVSGVYLNNKPGTGKTATVVVSEDQLSLAIGRDGQNARLAAKLTGWRIDIKSLIEAASDTLNKVLSDKELVEILDVEQETIPLIEALLTKKSAGRPLLPEEYDVLTKFVDRIETKTAIQLDPEPSPEEVQKTNQIRQLLPEQISEINLLDSSLPEHVSHILQEAGYLSVGDLFLQMNIKPDNVLKLQGIGPKAMAEVQNLISGLPLQEDTESTSDDIVETEMIETGKETDPQHLETEIKEEDGTIKPTETMDTEEIPGSEVDTSVVDSKEVAREEAVSASPDIGDEGESEEQAETLDKEKILDKWHTYTTSDIANGDFEEEKIGESDEIQKPKKKKKRRIVEYDPDRDMTLVRKEHKRGGADWEWEE